MQVVEDFLSAKEEQEIIAAIQAAERNTSGEIRVHIEAKAVKDHYKRAVKIFSHLSKRSLWVVNSYTLSCKKLRTSLLDSSRSLSLLIRK